MRPRFLLLTPLFLFAFASTARAQHQWSWDFRNNSLPFRANVSQLTEVRPTAEGLYIRTDRDGYILWNPHPLDGPVDVVTLRIKNMHATEAAWMWDPDAGLYQGFFMIPAADTFQNVDIAVSNYRTWRWDTEAVGLGLPAGAEILIERITFSHWGAADRVTEAWKTFWTFDAFRPYSINFLWGPLLTFNPIARRELFETLPPFAWSAMRAIYALLAAGIVTGAAIRLFHSDTSRGRTIGALTIIGTVVFCWLLLDLRMGLELLNYAKIDLRQYVFAAREERLFRNYDRFYTIADQALPLIHDHERYVLLAPSSSPAFANFRYLSYPSIPIKEEQSMDGVRLWVIVDRPDVSAEGKRLVRDGDTGTKETLAASGSVLMRLSDSSFLFLADE